MSTAIATKIPEESSALSAHYSGYSSTLPASMVQQQPLIPYGNSPAVQLMPETSPALTLTPAATPVVMREEDPMQELLNDESLTEEERATARALQENRECLNPINPNQPTEFTRRERTILEQARSYAIQRCTQALLNATSGDRYTDQIANGIFDTVPDQATISRTIRRLAEALRNVPFVHENCLTSDCQPRAEDSLTIRRTSAYVVRERPGAIHICPRFILNNRMFMVETLIHEAGHVIGIDQSRQDSEEYCSGNDNCRAECKMEDRLNNADAWARFVMCVGAL